MNKGRGNAEKKDSREIRRGAKAMRVRMIKIHYLNV